MKTSYFKIEGISCEACLKLIKRKMEKISGVLLATAGLNGSLLLQTNRLVSTKEIVDALKDTDYKLVTNNLLS